MSDLINVITQAYFMIIGNRIMSIGSSNWRKKFIFLKTSRLVSGLSTKRYSASPFPIRAIFEK
jgi:hypothetical protein